MSRIILRQVLAIIRAVLFMEEERTLLIDHILNKGYKLINRTRTQLILREIKFSWLTQT